MTKFLRRLLAPAALALTLTASPAVAQFSDAERAEIGDIVRAYLLENPEIIFEAVDILQAREEAEELERQRTQLSTLSDDLVVLETTPILGNPAGDVTLIEFFDYNCGFCRRMVDPIAALLDQDGGVRMVMKEFPILGPDSMIAAQAALAAREQGLYEEFHFAMMGSSGSLDEARIFELAERVGLDVELLQLDMMHPDVQSEIQSSYQLAEMLGIRGTPAFIVGDEIIPGAVSLETLQGLVAGRRIGE